MNVLVVSAGFVLSMSIILHLSLLPYASTYIYSRTPLAGLIGTAIHPDMQKIRIIGFL